MIKVGSLVKAAFYDQDFKIKFICGLIIKKQLVSNLSSDFLYDILWFNNFKMTQKIRTDLILVKKPLDK